MADAKAECCDIVRVGVLKGEMLLETKSVGMFQ